MSYSTKLVNGQRIYFYTDQFGNRRLDIFKLTQYPPKRAIRFVKGGPTYRGSDRYALKFYTCKILSHFQWCGFRTSYEYDKQRFNLKES